jgi:NAD-dependent protein deacetylase/lipoamidase
MTLSSPNSIETIHLAAELLKKSQCTVGLTGAGISTPSGIPDFRSPGIGLWTQMEPMEVASLSAFRHNPEQFYRWFQPLAAQVHSAQPNPAHIALAKLQLGGFVKTIITQNIDGLLSRAGALNVLEVHGSLETLTCTNCYRQVSSSLVIEEYVDHWLVPLCPACGSVLKPDIILYEEQLPVTTWNKAEAACRDCDLMLVAGTSLEVMPSAKLPVQAMNHGAKLVILNNGATFMDERANIVIHADVAEILPLIMQEVLNV